MVNFNGAILEEKSNFFNENHRGLRYGDMLFEEIRVVNGQLLFWEDHYFTLMASMRILRMEIPMEFTMEYIEDEIVKTIVANDFEKQSCVVTFNVFRNFTQGISPATNQVQWYISMVALPSPFYTFTNSTYEVELFKDFLVNQDMLSTLHTNNQTVEVVASVYAKENTYSDCLLLNTKKLVLGTIFGTIFLVKDGVLKTPPLSDGAKNHVTRTKVVEIIEQLPDMSLVEESISPFELQKADELFMVSISKGIVPITKYRKKQYTFETAKNLLGKLNAKARLANLK